MKLKKFQKSKIGSDLTRMKNGKSSQKKSVSIHFAPACRVCISFVCTLLKIVFNFAKPLASRVLVSVVVTLRVLPELRQIAVAIAPTRVVTAAALSREVRHRLRHQHDANGCTALAPPRESEQVRYDWCVCTVL